MKTICMQNKIIKLLVIFVVLFSLQGFSQTTEKSSHPLLDKYYPRKQNIDTNKTVPTQVNPIPETTTSPAITTQPAAITTTVPAETKIPAISTTTPLTTNPIVTTNPVVTPIPVAEKPDTIAAKIPSAQKIIQPQSAPPPPPYMDTRLGSSSKLYDTWEKNNNGAGTVTTSPK